MFLGPGVRKQLIALGSVSTVGIELVVSICIGYYGGQWIDSKLGTTFLQWVGLLFGLIAGYRSLYRLSKKYRQTNSQPPS